MKRKTQRIIAIAIVLLMIFALLISLLPSCTAAPDPAKAAGGTADSGTLSIIATLFPTYDFTRQIAGDKATVTLLLPPGVESHSFEPTPADIIKINNCDLFIYTGAGMEAWADSILEGVSSSNVTVLEVAKGIPLDSEEHDEHDESTDPPEKNAETENHLHEQDPHIWTSPVIAKIMVDNILESLCAIDPDNAEYYRTNAADYKAALDKLDRTFKDIVDNAVRKDIIFGGRFALRYFTEQYGIDSHAAFDSCSAETEPSAAVIANLIDRIKRDHIPVIYYEELTDPKVARSLSDETGAEMLLFHSCHNVTKDEYDNGVTYISLMNQNAENLKKGLN